VEAAARTRVGGVARAPGGVEAKFFRVGHERLYLRGVTYGTFRPDGAGDPVPEPSVVAADFRAMAGQGVNAVRVYTPPPRWLLDLAQEHGLRLLVGMSWDQHVDFLRSRRSARQVRETVRRGVRALGGHPAVFGYAVGSEIPAPIVRWSGRRAVERHLEALVEIVKAESPGALVTYVNYPTTEYLELPFLDFLAFNVYLESRERFAAYLARLQNRAGERPLVMAELGIDSRRHGEPRQAEAVEWLVRESFQAGCAGTFAFAWTDEWFRDGREILGWDFGLTTRAREPKPALAALARAYAEVPLRSGPDWPRVSVVCCSYNGAATIRDTLEGLARLEYPDYEVIVVDDGSTDATPRIAGEYDVRVISTPNRGLSSARNTGLAAATGEVVAFIDDDAYPDPHWLGYAVHALRAWGACGVGGPNLLPPEDGDVAECVANAPGGPCHVLLSDREAEHVPGCNMLFERSWLQRLGGFDPQFRQAGDDVDLCWRLQAAGGRIAFHPAAVVWHHRRSRLLRYWRQQIGYGKAEALLARKWPQKYNSAGHIPWSGRIYGRGLTRSLFARGRLYQGVWGSAPYQSFEPLVEGRALESLSLLPEIYLVLAGLASLGALGAVWPPLLASLPLLAALGGALAWQAVRSAARAPLRRADRSRARLLALRALTALLHLVQPLARLYGRLRHGLDPWRLRPLARWTLPRTVRVALWSEHWRPHPGWLRELESALGATRALVRPGDSYSAWDLSVGCGPLGRARVLMAVEEHGRGRQYVRFRIWPHLRCLPLAGAIALLASLAAHDAAWLAGGALGGAALLVLAAGLRDAGAAQAEILHALQGMQAPAPSQIGAEEVCAPARLAVPHA
jgi:GT2 family glycosyltransferase